MRCGLPRGRAARGFIKFCQCALAATALACVPWVQCLMIIAIRHKCGEGRGAMDELVGRLVANAGVDQAVAEKAVGIILAFLLKEGPPDKVQALISAMPGADAAVQAA